MRFGKRGATLSVLNRGYVTMPESPHQEQLSDDSHPYQQPEEPEDPPTVVIPNLIDDTSPKFLKPKEEFVKLLEVQNVPLKEGDKLPSLKDDKSMKVLVRTIDALVRVVCPSDPDIITVNKFYSQGSH